MQDERCKALGAELLIPGLSPPTHLLKIFSHTPEIGEIGKLRPGEAT